MYLFLSSRRNKDKNREEPRGTKVGKHGSIGIHNAISRTWLEGSTEICFSLVSLASWTRRRRRIVDASRDFVVRRLIFRQLSAMPISRTFLRDNIITNSTVI